VLLREHSEDFEDVDVLFVSPTVHNTHLEGSERVIRATDPDVVILQHFGTYRVTDENEYRTRGYPGEPRDRFPAALRGRYHEPAVGDVFALG